MSSYFCYHVLLLLVLLPGFSARGSEQDLAPKMLGSLSCSSAACHGREPALTNAPRSREEFLRWLQADPHGGASQTLASEKYQAILIRASQRLDRSVDPVIQAKCAQCHDPLGMTGDFASASSAGHGIGCESCHGNAEKWLARHYERNVERAELTALGMIDTKDLHVRGRQCAHCHVGSASHDMNHDMIAAGHPPLRFELAAYHDLIPQKHWNDSRERLERRDFQVQLWSAGQTTSAAARVELLSARCSPASSNWPEFSEFNCFSCHRRVPNTSRPRASGVTPGVPMWSRWNLALVDVDTSQPVRDLFEIKFPADPVDVGKANGALREQWTAHFHHGELTNQTLLKQLSASLSHSGADNDWDTRTQQYLALVAAERSYRDELAKLRFQARLDPSEYNRRLSAERSLLADLARVRTWLQFESSATKSVLRDEPLQFEEHRAEIGPQLKQIADQLRGRVLELK